MLTDIRAKSQITIPKSIVKHLGLAEGDQLDIYEKDGIIYMVPVTVYPKKYVLELQNEISMLKEDIQYGKQPTFDTIDALISQLEKE
ncbi:MAG: AbrB/MazE/SpoVT family DNA-binding domain-containing protein [Lachnospiraceae bacterium]|nr:AbrB/MazE/SpoVT family DNA-binding domain-containing protein [Lachnospiraceae bacterium]